MSEEELKAFVDNAISQAINGFEERLKELEQKSETSVVSSEDLEKLKADLEESKKTIATISEDTKSNKTEIDDIKETYKEQFESDRKKVDPKGTNEDFIGSVIKGLM